MSIQSTGPRTEAGKARSSQNAVKHGIFALQAVIAGEDAAEWDAFRAEISKAHAPVGLLETELAERVALQMWRLRRVARYEAELVRPVYEEGEGDDGPTIQECTRLLKEALDRVVRYEAHVGRQLKEALKMLHECQERRQATPLATSEPPQPEPQPPVEPSSFCQTGAVPTTPGRFPGILPRQGVSFADIDLVPKPTNGKTWGRSAFRV